MNRRMKDEEKTIRELEEIRRPQEDSYLTKKMMTVAELPPLSHYFGQRNSQTRRAAAREK